MQSIENEKKYNALKQSYDENKTKCEEIGSHYADLQTLHQCNTEQLKQISAEFEQSQIENLTLKQSVNDKEIELEQVQKQYVALNQSYTDLQQQYSAYLHKKNDKKMSESELKKISERH